LGDALRLEAARIRAETAQLKERTAAIAAQTSMYQTGRVLSVLGGKKRKENYVTACALALKEWRGELAWIVSGEVVHLWEGCSVLNASDNQHWVPIQLGLHPLYNERDLCYECVDAVVKDTGHEQRCRLHVCKPDPRTQTIRVVAVRAPDKSGHVEVAAGIFTSTPKCFHLSTTCLGTGAPVPGLISGIFKDLAEAKSDVAVCVACFDWLWVAQFTEAGFRGRFVELFELAPGKPLHLVRSE
jgi:hypothetical protein